MSGPLGTAERFHAALRDEDWEALGAIPTDDVHWIMPGDNLGPSGVRPVLRQRALTPLGRDEYDDARSTVGDTPS